MPSTGTHGLDGLQVFKQHGAVYLQVAHERKLRERLDTNGLLKILNQ